MELEFEVLVFVEGGNLMRTRRKTPQSKDKNQQQTCGLFTVFTDFSRIFMVIMVWFVRKTIVFAFSKTGILLD